MTDPSPGNLPSHDPATPSARDATGGTFNLPKRLADALLAHLGMNRPDLDQGPDPTHLADLTRAMAARIPYGSMAKLDAIAAGRTPPGADPVEVANQILTGKDSSWSCHAVVALAASVVNTLWPGHASVALTHRRDPHAPSVDLHSLLHVSGPLSPDPVLVDVYHYGPPLRVSQTTTGATPWRTCTLEAVPDHPWVVYVTGVDIPYTLAYHQVASSVDPAFLAAICDISVTHSGLAPRPSARLLCGDRLWRVAERPEQTASLRSWYSDGTGDEWSYQGPQAFSRAYAHMLAQR